MSYTHPKGNNTALPFLECGAFPPLFFFRFSSKKQANQSGGKAPHSKKGKAERHERAIIMTVPSLDRRRFLRMASMGAMASAGLATRGLAAPAAKDPTVLIIGAGMAGVSASFWLRQFGISSIIRRSASRPALTHEARDAERPHVRSHAERGNESA